ncbi:MAG: glycosyltransferase family 4 protein [Syntrophomonadaceae bacterium]|jgi:glycosyltransferase involved in cell wall biosynthesis
MRIGLAIDILDSKRSPVGDLMPVSSGIAVYLLELLTALAKLEQQHEYFLICSRKMRTPLPSNMPWELVQFPWTRLSPYARYSGAWREWAVAHCKLDLLHEVKPSEPCFRSPQYPLVVTVHDVMPLLHPEWFTFSNRTAFRLFSKHNLNRARIIICVSQHTANDLLSLMPHLAPKIRVIPIAGQTLHRPDTGREQLTRKYGVNKPYILNVSTIEPRKGHLAMFEALKILKESGCPHQLVCIGGLGWHTRGILNHPDYQAHQADIIFPGAVDRTTLSCFYHHAEAFVYPSLYEGFGIPPLEAMQIGLPVVASANSSMPEVLGEAAYYLSPQPTGAEIARALIDLLTTPGKKEHYQEMSLKQASRFSWQQTAQQTLEVYEEIVQSS